MIDLTYSRRLILEAELAEPPAARFVGAYQSAQQAALAVIAAAPGRARGRSDVWRLLTSAAPELAEWAGFFSAVAPTVAAVQAGALVSERGAADLIRDAQGFMGDAVGWLRRREEILAEAG